MKINKKKIIVLLIKLAIVIFCFYLIAIKLDLNKLKNYLFSISISTAILVFIVLTLAHVVSAFRMRFYYSTINEHLTIYFANALYFVGLLYNNLLPGGIGGDGYKLFVMKKLAEIPIKNSFFVIISDRASGLYLLIILCLGLSFKGSILTTLNIHYLIPILLFIIATIGYFLGCKYIFKQAYKTSFLSLPYSLAVQILGVICGLLLFTEVNPELSFDELSDYILVFMLSMIVALMPISIGSVGLREVSFLYAAKYLGLNAELGVAVCFIFYIFYLSTSFIGLIYINSLDKVYNRNLLQ